MEAISLPAISKRLTELTTPFCRMGVMVNLQLSELYRTLKANESTIPLIHVGGET